LSPHRTVTSNKTNHQSIIIKLLHCFHLSSISQAKAGMEGGPHKKLSARLGGELRGGDERQETNYFEE